jgi:hypothetical protein
MKIGNIELKDIQFPKDFDAINSSSKLKKFIKGNIKNPLKRQPGARLWLSM